LTEAELNSEQAYVIAKNKLHNRYLHGWGIVCGLEVVCHDCVGWVTVKQGYAIDPCGNDIIVCDDKDFPVLEEIRKCREGRRRRRRADCDPVKAPDDKSCDDIEEHWCITIEYREEEARPIAPLRNEKKGKCGCGSSCGCGCNGNGNGNGNGKSKKSCGCGCQGAQTSVATGTAKTNVQCEPTRIYEKYRLNVVEEPRHCASRLFNSSRELKGDVYTDTRMSKYLQFLGVKNNDQAMILRILKELPQDSLLMRIINCLVDLAEFVQKRLSQDDLRLLRRIIRNCDRRGRGDRAIIVDPQEDNEALHRLCCNLQRLIYDLYTENPFNVRCDYSCPPCPPIAREPQDPTTRGGPLRPGGRVQPGGPGVYEGESSDMASICCLAENLLQYAADCICHAFLPPCPPNPEDDRLILACLTIKNGKIINICNFSCRHYAGSFPSMYYWLSLVPIIPLFGKALQFVCCNPHLMQTMFDLFDRRRWYERRTDEQRVAGVDGGAGKRKQVSDIIRSFVMDSFTDEAPAEATGEGKTASPESDLDELREQIKALQAEMGALKRGGQG
jgi:hypothetical protein